MREPDETSMQCGFPLRSDRKTLQPGMSDVKIATDAGTQHLVSFFESTPTRHRAGRGARWWNAPEAKRKSRVPARHRRAWARALLFVLAEASEDRGLAGLGIGIAGGSAAFATGMILGAGASHPAFVRRQAPDAVDGRAEEGADAATDRFDDDRMGSIFSANIDAVASRPQQARPLAENGHDADEPSDPGASNYALRYADVGAALVQGPGGTLVVVPGSVVPEAGQVRSIEKRAGRWVVVTSGGTIEGPAM